MTRLQRSAFQRVAFVIALVTTMCALCGVASAWEGTLASQTKIADLSGRSASDPPAVAYNSDTKSWLVASTASNYSDGTSQIYTQRVGAISEGSTSVSSVGNLNQITNFSSSSHPRSPSLTYNPVEKEFLLVYVVDVPSGTTQSTTAGGPISWSHLVDGHQEIYGVRLAGDTGSMVSGTTPFRMTNSGELSNGRTTVANQSSQWDYLTGEEHTEEVASPSVTYANGEYMLVWQSSDDDQADFPILTYDSTDTGSNPYHFTSSYTDVPYDDSSSTSCNGRNLIFGAAFSVDGDPIDRKESEGAFDATDIPGAPSAEGIGDSYDPDSLEIEGMSTDDLAQLKQLVRLENSEFKVSGTYSTEDSSADCAKLDRVDPNIATNGSGFMVSFTRTAMNLGSGTSDEDISTGIYTQGITSAGSLTTSPTGVGHSTSDMASIAAPRWRAYDASNSKAAYDPVSQQYGIAFIGDSYDEGDGNHEVFYQRVDSDGGSLGGDTDFQVSATNEGRDVFLYGELGLGFDSVAGKMIATWTSDTGAAGDHDVYSQRLTTVNADGTGPTLDGSNERQSHMGNDGESTYRSYSTAFSSSGLGPNLVAWQGDDDTTGGYIGLFGTAIGSNVAAPAAETTESSDSSDIDVDYSYDPDYAYDYGDAYKSYKLGSTTATEAKTLKYYIRDIKLKKNSQGKGVISGNVISSRASSFKMEIGATKPSTLKKKMKIKVKTIKAKTAYKKYPFKKKLGLNWGRMLKAAKKGQKIVIRIKIFGVDKATKKKRKQKEDIKVN